MGNKDTDDDVCVCMFVCVLSERGSDCAVVNRASVRGGGSLTGCFFPCPLDVSGPNLTSSLRVNNEAQCRQAQACGHTPTHKHKNTNVLLSTYYIEQKGQTNHSRSHL